MNASGLANRSFRWVTTENCQRTLKDWKEKRPTSPLQNKQLTQNLTFPPLTDKNCWRGFARSIKILDARKGTIPWKLEKGVKPN